MEGSAIEKLIADISKLPGLGRRSAQRIALYLLKNKTKTRFILTGISICFLASSILRWLREFELEGKTQRVPLKQSL